MTCNNQHDALTRYPGECTDAGRRRTALGTLHTVLSETIGGFWG